MGLILTDSRWYHDICDAIRARSDRSDTFLPSEMAAAILAIPNVATPAIMASLMAAEERQVSSVSAQVSPRVTVTTLSPHASRLFTSVTEE